MVVKADIKTVIFDAGGTLICAPDLFAVLAELYPRAQAYARLKDLMMDDVRAMSEGRKGFATVESIIASALRSVSRELGRADVSGRAGEIYRKTFVVRSRLQEGAAETLSFLQGRGLKLIMASDADAGILREELERLDIARFFSEFVVSSEAACYKPGDAFVAALRKVAGDPSRALFVGDAEADIQTGRRLGARTALIGGARVTGGADYRIGKLKEVADIVAGQN